jgi:hypothetical protein
MLYPEKPEIQVPCQGNRTQYERKKTISERKTLVNTGDASFHASYCSVTQRVPSNEMKENQKPHILDKIKQWRR